MSIFNIIFSGTQIGNNFPYLQFRQISCNLDNINTCTERFENYVFAFTLYHNKAKELIDYNDIFRQKFDKWNLLVQGRLNTQLLWQEATFVEDEVGVYEYENLYFINFQRNFHADFITGRCTGDNLYAALFNRYNNTALKHRCNGFSTTRFGKHDWERPFLYIPEYKFREELITTCDINDLVEISICYETSDPANDYSLLDEIDHTFSYSGISFPSSVGKINSVLNWVGNDFDEIEPMLWRGCVRYEIGIQRNI